MPQVSSSITPERRHLDGSRDERVGGAPERPGWEVVPAHASLLQLRPSATQSKAAPSILAVIGRGLLKLRPLIGLEEV